MGVIDMSYIYEVANDAVVPGPSILHMSMISAEEERERGVIDLYKELHEEAGLYLLGRTTTMKPFGLFTIILNEPIVTPQDLSGRLLSQEFSQLPAFWEMLGVTIIYLLIFSLFIP